MADDTARCPQCGRSFPSTVRLCPEDGTVLEHQTAGASQLGKVLDGKYRLDGFLSQGGMGSVYRATHVMLGKTVAVKLINPELLTTPEVVRRFQREARAATALHHPNIVAVYDLGQTADGTLYIAMEFVDGPSLKAVIAGGGPVAPARTIALLRQTASALSFAHRHNIVHRDLKPHNIMIATADSGQEVPKLVDFGIAKTFDEATQLTMTGFALGTPQYMAPEQAEGRPVDARSDLYSLGIIFYEMLTGDVPFNDSSAPAILIKHIKETPVAPSTKNPRVVIPPELETIVLRCLEKDPARRFQSADEFIAVLEQSAASIPGAAAAMEPTLLSAAAASASFTPPASPASQTPIGATGAATRSASGPTIAATVTTPQAPGTRPTAIPSQVANPTGPPATQPAAAPPAADASSRLGLVAVVAFLLIGAAGAFVYLRQGREQSAIQSTDAPAASPAMASTPPPSASPASDPVAAAQPASASNARASDATATVSAPQTASQSSAAAQPSRPAAGQPPRPAAPPQVIARADSAASTAVPVAPAPATGPTATRKPTGGSAVGGQAAADQTPPAAMPEHPAVFFQCAGAPEICSVLRTEVDNALEKGGFGNVRNPARADIAVHATAGGVQERVSQQFGTTFAVRTYSIELSGEAARTGENIPMPPPASVSFDPQFGSERAVEKARLVAGDLVDRLKAFAERKRRG